MTRLQEVTFGFGWSINTDFFELPILTNFAHFTVHDVVVMSSKGGKLFNKEYDNWTLKLLLEEHSLSG